MGIFASKGEELSDAQKNELRSRLADAGFTGSAQTTEDKALQNNSAARKKQAAVETFMSKQKTEASLDAVDARAAREETGVNEQQLDEQDAGEKRRRRRLRRRQKG
jgi:hypothetical protein